MVSGGEIFGKVVGGLVSNPNLNVGGGFQVARQCFEVFDQDGNGLITENEFIVSEELSRCVIRF